MKVDQLKSYSKILLDDKSSDPELEDAAQLLTDFFEAFSSIKNRQNLKSKQEAILSRGTVISPSGAAMCTQDSLRVSYFLRGAFQAINDFLYKFKNRPIHILYAGSGPYGTLLIPLLPYFSSKDIQITILDYHEVSLKSVSNIVEALGLNQYFKKYIQADATRYKHPKDDTIDIIVSETMTAALEKEMQVPITLNLAPQLCKNGIFIPQNIAIKAMFLSVDNAFIKMGTDSKWNDALEFGTVFEIDKDRGIEFSKEINKDYILANEITFPENIKKDTHPFLITEITVYDEIKMCGYQCTLNHPVGFPPYETKEASSKVDFIYKLNENLGLTSCNS
ncbi:MAG: hypothetical protein GQ474_02925 [Sulfurimonas sp.]|nr:hypothetical protein [Sulfurimonas sp.]